jgi:tetrahydromethanopterin S-methyltransferase subunit G
MEKIKQIIAQVDSFLAPYVEKIEYFLGKDYYIIYAAIGALIIFLIIPGLFTFIKRAPKLFLLIIIVLAAASLIAYFLVYKTAPVELL